MPMLRISVRVSIWWLIRALVCLSCCMKSSGGLAAEPAALEPSSESLNIIAKPGLLSANQVPPEEQFVSGTFLPWALWAPVAGEGCPTNYMQEGYPTDRLFRANTLPGSCCDYLCAYYQSTGTGTCEWPLPLSTYPRFLITNPQTRQKAACPSVLSKLGQNERCKRSKRRSQQVPELVQFQQVNPGTCVDYYKAYQYAQYHVYQCEMFVSVPACQDNGYRGRGGRGGGKGTGSRRGNRSERSLLVTNSSLLPADGFTYEWMIQFPENGCYGMAQTELSAIYTTGPAAGQAVKLTNAMAGALVGYIMAYDSCNFEEVSDSDYYCGAPLLRAAADHTCALSLNGHLSCWGAHTWASVTSSGVIAYGVGESGVCLCRGRGKYFRRATAWCDGTQTNDTYCVTRCLSGSTAAGAKADARLLSGMVTSRGVWAISIGKGFACVLRPTPGALPSQSARATVICKGENSLGQTTVPSKVSVKSWSPYILSGMSSGHAHTCVLLLNYKTGLACWGANSDGQIDIPRNLGFVVAVAAGYAHTCVVRGHIGTKPPFRGGKVICWGSNSSGQITVPENLPEAVLVAAGWYHTCAVTRLTGQVHCWGDNSKGQCSGPEGLSGAVTLAAGRYHTCAGLSSGKVVCWGDGSQGQLRVPEQFQPPL